MAEYCQKEESRVPGSTPFVYGQLNKPGQNNVGKTLSTMYTKWKSGTTVEEMVENPDTAALAMRYAKSFQYVRQSSIKPRDPSYEHVVWVCYGPPGTGKSTWLDTLLYNILHVLQVTHSNRCGFRISCKVLHGLLMGRVRNKHIGYLNTQVVLSRRVG